MRNTSLRLLRRYLSAGSHLNTLSDLSRLHEKWSKLELYSWTSFYRTLLSCLAMISQSQSPGMWRSLTTRSCSHRDSWRMNWPCQLISYSFQLRASFLTYFWGQTGWIIFGWQVSYYCHFRFLKAGMNVVDLLGILPYFASLIISLVMTATAQGQANYQENWIFLNNLKK